MGMITPTKAHQQAWMASVWWYMRHEAGSQQELRRGISQQ
jgi:hypothetical protein